MRRRILAVSCLVAALVLTDAGIAAGHASPPSLAQLAQSVHSLKMRTSTPEAVAHWCTQIAARVGRPVVCPRLVPAARIITRVGDLGPLDTPSAALYTLTFNNGGEDPASPLSLHWIVGVGDIRLIRRNILGDAINEVKGKPRYLGSHVLLGYRAQAYRFPAFPAGGPYGGHTLALVAIGGSRAVFASVHGDNHLDASLAMAVELASRAANR